VGRGVGLGFRDFVEDTIHGNRSSVERPPDVGYFLGVFVQKGTDGHVETHEGEMDVWSDLLLAFVAGQKSRTFHASGGSSLVAFAQFVRFP